jgi:pyruvate dehydrogenase E1 component
MFGSATQGENVFFYITVYNEPSWTELRREALACDTHNLMNPDADRRVPYVTRALSGRPGPVIAVSDYMRAVPDQISRWVPGDYSSLGTDGFGFSDTRAATRRFFHVDAPSIVLQTLSELARRGEVAADTPAKAAAQYGLL